MSFFHRSFLRHFRTSSSLVSRSVIASSAAATCLCYISVKEKASILEDDGKKDDNNVAEVRSLIWDLSSASSWTPTAMTTDCLAMSDLQEFFKPTKKQNVETKENNKPHLLFLGTGSSTGCPKPICAMKFRGTAEANAPKQSATQSFVKPDPASCRISHLALEGGDPKSNRNYRNNPCLLIHHYDEDSKTYKNIIIDVGKTFRETALRWFPIHGVESLDAIILTHHHMDAAAGLDDVRGFQGRKWIGDGKYVRQSIPLYMSDFCHLNLQSQFPWLLPKKSAPAVVPQQAKDRPTVKRDVASFDVTIFKDYQQEVVLGTKDGAPQRGGFTFVPLPVWHGDDLISHGFAFSLHPGPSSSSRPLNVVYLSDISRMVPETLEFIQKKLPPTDILVVDSLLWEKPNPVHFTMQQAVELSQIIQPRMRTYLIGMSCDNFFPHDEMNAYLRETYGKRNGDGNNDDGAILMAHDGLVVELPEN